MKSHNSNFPDSLLQQFNFGATTTDALAEENEDAPTVGKEEVQQNRKENQRGARGTTPNGTSQTMEKAYHWR